MQNLPPSCARVIMARLCTLKEAQTDYSLEDIFNLDEILMVANYHEWLATRKQKP